jgi:1-acyl-sn-glycerol-3-phosphate acyltransferase
MPTRPLATVWTVVRVIAETLMFRIMRWRFDIRGLENVPREGPAVVAFNHHSYFDFVAVGWPIVAKLRRGPRFLGKREVLRMPVIGALARWADVVPVDRHDPTARHGAFDAAIAALRGGDLVILAPEQTISTSYDLLPFRTGAVRMAQAAGAPIVPAIGFGTQRFSGKGTGTRPVFRLPVSIRYGEPIHVGPDDDPVAVTARLQEVSAGMLDEVLADYPDRPAPGDDWWWPRRLGGSAPDHAEVLAAHEARFRERRAGREDDAGGGA